MSKFTRKPKPAERPAVENFIDGAERRAVVSRDTQALPWEHPSLRDDVFKLYNLRLPEPYLLKLKYIAEHTSDSMQKFCLDALLPAIDAKIEQFTKDHGDD